MGKVPETYLYEVRCTRVIKLDCGVEITTPRSLYLTKDDVKKCLQTAYVFRRFADHGLERVTVANLDRLHNATFIPESEWNGTVEEVEPEVVEEVKEEENKTKFERDDIWSFMVEDEESGTAEESTDTPEEAAELTSANEEVNGDVVDDTVEDVSNDEEAKEDESEDLTTEEDLNVAELEDENDEIGESDHSEESTARTGAVKYTYKKHNKNKH